MTVTALSDCLSPCSYTKCSLVQLIVVVIFISNFFYGIILLNLHFLFLLKNGQEMNKTEEEMNQDVMNDGHNANVDFDLNELPPDDADNPSS